MQKNPIDLITFPLTDVPLVDEGVLPFHRVGGAYNNINL